MDIITGEVTLPCYLNYFTIPEDKKVLKRILINEFVKKKIGASVGLTVTLCRQKPRRT